MHGHPVPARGRGRTDAGVHAMGQVANFYTDIAGIAAERFLLALNRLMPRDVRVVSASEADFDFHSRYDARLRRYRYFALCSSSPIPSGCDTVTISAGGRISSRSTPPRLSSSGRPTSRPSRRPRTSRPTARASCRNRPSAGREKPSSTRSRPTPSSGGWCAPSSDRCSPTRSRRRAAPRNSWPAPLAARDRSLAGPTAPARGLFLWNVEYYARPTRPGRGDYWTVAEKRGVEGSS